MNESSSAALVYSVVYCRLSTSHLVYLLLSARSLNIRRAGLSLSDVPLANPLFQCLPFDWNEICYSASLGEFVQRYRKASQAHEWLVLSRGYESPVVLRSSTASPSRVTMILRGGNGSLKLPI